MEPHNICIIFNFSDTGAYITYLMLLNLPCFLQWIFSSLSRLWIFMKLKIEMAGSSRTRVWCKPLLGLVFTLTTIALILSILDWLATTILLPKMLFSNFDFLQQNFAVISKTFLDNSDSATVSVLSHSGPARTLFVLLSKNIKLTKKIKNPINTILLFS